MSEVRVGKGVVKAYWCDFHRKMHEVGEFEHCEKLELKASNEIEVMAAQVAAEFEAEVQDTLRDRVEEICYDRYEDYRDSIDAGNHFDEAEMRRGAIEAVVWSRVMTAIAKQILASYGPYSGNNEIEG